MTKLEKLYSIIENSREVGVKLSKDVLQQVEELEEGIIKEEILPALGNDIAPRLEPIRTPGTGTCFICVALQSR